MSQISSGIIFAIIAATAFGCWTVFHQQASSKIDYLVGAILVSLTAVVLGIIIIIPRFKTAITTLNFKGIIFVVLAGVCALGIDYFALKAYGSGGSISVIGPIIMGGSIAVAAIIGFFLGESITFIKILGLILVIAGASILATMGK